MRTVIEDFYPCLTGKDFEISGALGCYILLCNGFVFVWREKDKYFPRVLVHPGTIEMDDCLIHFWGKDALIITKKGTAIIPIT